MPALCRSPYRVYQKAANSPPHRSQYHSVGKFIVPHSVQRSVFCASLDGLVAVAACCADSCEDDCDARCIDGPVPCDG